MVSEQCLVKFKIEHYVDEVLCDIMPIDCCHILLGRPWQYDRYAMHDGRLNQYTLWLNRTKNVLFPLIESLDEVNCTIVWVCVVNGKKQILLPLIESPDEVSCNTIKFCMVNGKQFEKELKKNQVYFGIVPRGSSVGSNDRAIEVGNIEWQ